MAEWSKATVCKTVFITGSNPVWDSKCIVNLIGKMQNSKF